MVPAVCRIVCYVLPEGERSAGEVRPAIIVRLLENERVNLQQFTDGANDGHTHVTDPPTTVWRLDVPHDEDRRPGTWHWPVRSGA